MKGMLVAVCSALLLVGCAPTIYNVNLKKMPSENFISKIENDESKLVSYTFESELPDEFKYTNIVVDLNAGYAANVKNYMRAKYSIEKKGDYHVEFILQECNLEVVYAGAERYQTSAASTSGYHSSGSVVAHNNTISTELTVEVRVNKGGEIIKKEFISFSENTGNSYDARVVQVGINMAIDKSLQMIDKFLDKTIATTE